MDVFLPHVLRRTEERYGGRKELVRTEIDLVSQPPGANPHIVIIIQVRESIHASNNLV